MNLSEEERTVIVVWIVGRGHVLRERGEHDGVGGLRGPAIVVIRVTASTPWRVQVATPAE